MALVGEHKLRLSTLLTNLNKRASLTRMLSLLYSVNSFYTTIFFILQNAHNKQAILRKKHITPIQIILKKEYTFINQITRYLSRYCARASILSEWLNLGKNFRPLRGDHRRRRRRSFVCRTPNYNQATCNVF